MPIAPGEADVLKDKDSAFCSPHINLSLMEDELAKEWLASSNTIYRWTDLINLANQKVKESIDNSGNDLKIPAKEFDKLVETKTKILQFQTPKAKIKQAEMNMEDNDSDIDSGILAKETSTFKYNPIPILSLIIIIDKQISNLRKVVRSIWL